MNARRFWLAVEMRHHARRLVAVLVALVADLLGRSR